MKRLINLVFHLVFGSLILAVLILGYKQANAQTAARPPTVFWYANQPATIRASHAGARERGRSGPRSE